MNSPRYRAVLGIDPGGPGAAVLLSPSSALVFAAAWKANRKGWNLSIYEPGGVSCRQLPGRESAIGGYLAALVPQLEDVPLLAVEDVFLHRQHPNLKTTVKLARFGARVVAPLELVCGTGAEFVQASAWRAVTLGLNPYTKRAVAKAASLQFIPARVPGLSDALDALGPLDHITDAAGIALWRQCTAALPVA